MNILCWLPNWNELHPLVIHIPIVLALLTPLFVLVGAVVRSERRRIFLVSALILMLSATASMYVATQTGHAASRCYHLAPQADAVLLQYRTLAGEARTMFTAATALFGLLLLLTLRFRMGLGQINPVIPVAFLTFYVRGVVLLFSTAEQGGRLVHEFGL